MKKRFLSLVMVLSIVVIGLTFITVKAGTANVLTNRLNFTEVSTGMDMISYGEDVAAYINGRKTDFENTIASAGLESTPNQNIDYNTLFSTTEGSYRYAVINSIGDPEHIFIDGALYNEFPVLYKTYNVNVSASGTAVVRYEANGGEYVTFTTVNIGAEYPLANNSFPAPEGKMFSKWDVVNVGQKNPGDVLNITGGVTAIALWDDDPEYHPDQKITSLNITIEKPLVGDTVNTVIETDPDYGEYELPAKFPNVSIDNQNCELDFTVFIKGLPSQMVDFDGLFKGTFEEGQYYYVEVSLLAREGYVFAGNDDIEITVNGETTNFEKNEWNAEGTEYFLLYAKVPATTESSKTEEYNLNSGDFTVVFKDIPNHHYELLVADFMSLTEEELEQYDVTKEIYEEALKQITENTKQYGDLLRVYAIQIHDGGIFYEEAATIKIKLTDELKKYNTFKFVYVDENNEFKVGEIVNLRIEGDYIVGEVPHFSAYALVGSNVDNPKTLDNILLYVSLLGISLIGIIGITYYTKKKLSK